MNNRTLAALICVITLSAVPALAAPTPNKTEGSPKTMIKVSEKAPDFALKASDGSTFKLADHIGKQNIVLFFYPKDNTAVCTAEVCSFRDSYEVFKEAGAEVVGISGDSVDSHKGFASKHNLQYTLLSDEGNKVRKLYGIPNTMGLIPGRATFLIDKHGIVRNVFESQMQAQKHVDETLKILKTLQ